jgi:antitoxin component of RelBE/YafQ-DinJ toxin-antitoxin module
MRTTVRLDDNLLQEAKIRAAEQGITLTQLIDESLRERLSARPRHQKAQPFQLRSYGKGGTRPAVNLDDNRAIRDLMDDNAPFLQGGSPQEK